MTNTFEIQKTYKAWIKRYNTETGVTQIIDNVDLTIIDKEFTANSQGEIIAKTKNIDGQKFIVHLEFWTNSDSESEVIDSYVTEQGLENQDLSGIYYNIIVDSKN